MNTSKFLVLQPNELAQRAREGLAKNDEVLLKHVDFAFHHIFLMRSKKASDESRVQYIDAILSAIDFGRQNMPSELIWPQRLLVRWEHLAELMDAFRHARDKLADARLFVQSQTHGSRILNELKAAAETGGPGLNVTALANKLNLSSPGLVAVLNKLEQQDIIERHRSGRNVFVSLGLLGQLLDESPKQQKTAEMQIEKQKVPEMQIERKWNKSYLLSAVPNTEMAGV